ncbi:MAG: 2-amino-4-hydroxy-6-hydroxymethyldihydropteridine diphosphokinase [Candidatus Omnitrophica bacterium]|nr:2-amino-4-hydroxy-6-hydroxymethyldihydropteridine diphosphokinase [Candidatus Omnitrophota bacterium]
MPVVFIGVGSNLGDRGDYINKAINCLKKTPSITVKKISTIIETKPQDAAGQRKYLNAVIKLETNLVALDLLKELQSIEGSLGRVRSFKNAPRRIDLDILLYGEEIINEPDLEVPHPRMFERKFVIEPLLEIEPELKNKLIKHDYHRKY